MRYIFCLLSFMIIALAGEAQDSLQPSGISINEYERLIKHYRYYKPDSAIYFVNLGLQHATNHGDIQGRALMLIQHGMIDDNEGEFENAKKNYEEALKIFRKLQNDKGIATVTIRLGVVELRNGHYHTATVNFLEALKLSEAKNDTFGMMEAQYSISWAYLDQGKTDQALEHLLTAEDLNKKIVPPWTEIA